MVSFRFVHSVQIWRTVTKWESLYSTHYLFSLNCELSYRMNQSFILFNAAVSSRPHYALGPTRRQSVRPSVRPSVRLSLLCSQLTRKWKIVQRSNFSREITDVWSNWHLTSRPILRSEGERSRSLRTEMWKSFWPISLRKMYQFI